MGQWSEIKYSLGFNILFPRFCLYVVLPCLILIIVPAPPAIPWLLAVLQPGYAKVVLAGSLLFFGLSVVANLNVSRYLRFHQTLDSPYVYEASYNPRKRSSYFRIQVADRAVFRRLLRGIRHEHPRKMIQFWLLIDDLLLVLPFLVMLPFAIVFVMMPWLANRLWNSLKGHQPHPVP